MESFVTATGRITRGGGSSHASSSRAAGKAPEPLLNTGDNKSTPLIDLFTIKPAADVAQAI